ncbi:hypothetical protein Tco_0642889 [Tanacetum coccineum]
MIVKCSTHTLAITVKSGFEHQQDNPSKYKQDIPEAGICFDILVVAKSNSRVLEEAENPWTEVSSESFSNGVKIKEGGSILEILEEIIR